ncbi:hypothetical protein KAX02_08005 [candidate division WOR-3 bacterium]|nr:hypothetical protein [candidate division WOR-3 bacterium]
MNKQEIIEKARTAILKGEKEVDGYYIYTSKVDLDMKLDKNEIPLWEQTRQAILEFMYFVVIDINTSETERGLHTVINWLSEEGETDHSLNFIQMLLGDDVVRVKINERRIEKGISFERANILFSKILKRYPHEQDSRINIALERELGIIK